MKATFNRTLKATAMSLALACSPVLAHASEVADAISATQSNFTMERSEVNATARLGNVTQQINGVGSIVANIASVGGSSNVTVRDSKANLSVQMGNLVQRVNGIGFIKLNVGTVSGAPTY